MLTSLLDIFRCLMCMNSMLVRHCIRLLIPYHVTTKHSNASQCSEPVASPYDVRCLICRRGCKQCFFSQNIGLVTPKTVYFIIQKNSNSFNFEKRSTGCKHLTLVLRWTSSNYNMLYCILLKCTNDKRSCLNASWSHFKNRRTAKYSNPLTFNHVLQLLKMQTSLFPLPCCTRYQKHVTFRRTFFGIRTTVRSRTCFFLGGSMVCETFCCPM